MSPEAATLGKYGSYNVNYYTGTPGISVPLHEINEAGLKIPIGLSYDAAGFIPNKNAGVAGLNWNLQAGGAITRVVNVVPDDKYNPNGNERNGMDIGYMYAQTHGFPSYSSEYIRKLEFFSLETYNVPLGTQERESYDLEYEYNPDVFTFNFLGHSGKFFMDNTGQVRVVSDRRYTVDITDLKPQFNFDITLTNLIFSASPAVNGVNNSLMSRIVMTSDDGYKFYFGGAFKDLELSFSYADPGHKAAIPTSGQINAWYLTKVVTPDGEEILFNYKKYTTDDLNVIKMLFETQAGAWDNIEAGFLEIKYHRNHKIVLSYVDGGTQVYLEDHDNTQSKFYKSVIKHAYLEEIVTKTQKVKFNYTEKDLNTRFYHQTIPTQILAVNDNYYTQKLSSVQVTDTHHGMMAIPDQTEAPAYFPTSKEISFTYDYWGNRLFLKGVKINNKAQYSFTYSNTSSLPDPLTRGVDKWGFYNGSNSNTDLIAFPVTNSAEFESDFSSAAAYRLANGAYANYGMLSSVEYPTGGKTEFTFEPHTYSKVLKRKVSTGRTPFWVTESGTAGGVRIKEIKNTPGTTTTYHYVNDYDQNPGNSSSGLLIDNGVYYVDFTRNVSGSPLLRNARISDNNISAASSYRQPHVEYKEVIETTGEGFTKHKYSTYESNPDVYHLGDDAHKITSEYSTNNFNGQLMRLFKYSSKEDERGKLLKTEVYNFSAQLQKSVEYTYNDDPARDNARTIAAFQPYSLSAGYYGKWFGIIHSYALYYYHNNVTKIVEKDYSASSSNPVTITTALKYKSHTNPLLEEKKVTQSDGSDMITKLKYPEDLSSGNSTYQGMVNKFMVSPVIEEAKYRNTTLLGVSKHQFGQFNGNLYKPQHERKVNQLALPNTDIDLLTVNAYSSNGKVLEVARPNHGPDAYIWGYNQQFPIAQVINAKSSEVFFDSFEDPATWDGIVRDNTRAHAGTYSARIDNASAGEVIWHSQKWLTVSLTQPTKFRFSGWVYSTGPEAELFLFMKTAAETGYFTHVESVSTNVTNKWVYVEKEVTVPANITRLNIRLDNNSSGTLWFDDIRLHPSAARMTTYTYAPLAGMTSETDINNRPIYYEYDVMGRLMHIRDFRKNILKKYCYNYYNQVEECFANTNAIWEPTAQVRCKACPQNASYYTNIQEVQEVDTNPLSATYGTYRWVETGPGNCVAQADWQNTQAALECEIVSGNNTGYQLREQRDMNPCSPTYNLTRWVNAGYNPTACPLPPACTSSNCQGVDKKCVTGVCETACRQNLSSTYVKVPNTNYYRWKCVYRYVWSDGSYSQNYEEYNTSACGIATICPFD